MLSWWRRNRFSASSRHGGLNKSTMNIPSECRIASIGRDHAMILPHDANPKPDGIFGKDTSSQAPKSVVDFTDFDESDTGPGGTLRDSRRPRDEPSPAKVLADGSTREKHCGCNRQRPAPCAHA